MAGRKSKIRAHIYPLEKAIHATIKVPGSKSYTNRALIIAALADGVSILYNCSDSTDSLLMIKLLKKLGVKITSNSNNVTVYGNGGKFNSFTGTLNVHDAGTVMRFLLPLCSQIPGEIILKGTDRMHVRPVKGLVDALIHIGADISYLNETGFLPIKIKGGQLHGGKVNIDASQSSQFVSALLMTGPLLDSGLEIISTAEIVSCPYIDMTIDVMKDFGVLVENNNHQNYIVKKGQAYRHSEYVIEGDASCATYFLGIAALSQSTIRVTNLPSDSHQGDVHFADLLSKMGCKVKLDSTKNFIEVTGVKKLKPIEANLIDMPDAAPALAVVASFAIGKTILSGLKNLELKESKRLTAIETELNKMGIICHSDGEQLTINGGNPKGTIIETYKDHRIAMALAMAGIRVKDLEIDSPEVVRKSYPDFWNELERIGIRVDFKNNDKNIVLIGFMGAGKTTVSRQLAKKLKLPVLETDDEIISRSGLKSVNEIFDKKGEAYFRKSEKEVVLDFSKKSNSIISCGGGVVNNPQCMKSLKESGTIIFLSASFKTIAQRLNGSSSRPLLTDIKKAKELFQKRTPLYKNYADKVIKTDNLTPEEVANIIDSNA